MHRLVLFACLTLAGCAAAAPPPNAKKFDANGEVTLAPGERVLLEKNIPLHLINVVEDSRCPQDTTCVWAGEVKILLDGIKGVFRPSYLLEGGSISVDKYQVTLVRVEPQPVSTAKIARAEYRATFKVSPAPH